MREIADRLERLGNFSVCQSRSKPYSSWFRVRLQLCARDMTVAVSLPGAYGCLAHEQALTCM